MPGAYGTSDGGSGWKPGKNPTIQWTRENGVPRLKSKSKANSKKVNSKKVTTQNKPKYTVNSDSTGSKRWTQTDKGPGRNTSNDGKRTTYRFQEFDRYKAKDKEGGSLSDKKSVLKDVHDLKKIKGAAARRTFRENKGLYLGKYYGPDQFKGDKELNKAWVKAGKPNADSFARSHNKSGNRSLG